MQNPISASEAFQQYGSFDKLAEALLAAHADIFEGQAVRSLAARLSEFNRAKQDWWVGRPKAVECLLDFVGVEKDDFVLEQKSGKYLFRFDGFASLGTLDLQREPCWEIASPVQEGTSAHSVKDRWHTAPTLDFWLSSDFRGRPEASIEYLLIADEVEFQVQSLMLAAAGRHRVLSVESLDGMGKREMELLLESLPLALAIRAPMSVKRISEIFLARQQAPLLVICPYPHRWEPAEIDRANKAGAKIHLWGWMKNPDWRTSLLNWVESRTERHDGNGLSFRRNVHVILDFLDPQELWLNSVGDVLSLCGAIHKSGYADIKSAVDAQDDGARLLKLLFGGSEVRNALSEPLIAARWEKFDLPWSGSLSATEWSGLSAGIGTFESLLSQQVIRQDEVGYDFSFPVEIRLHLRRYLLQRLKKGGLLQWETAYFDNSRRPFIDAALEALDPATLEYLVDELVQAPVSAATIGAAESLFVAIGQRLMRQERFGARLSPLAGMVLAELREVHELLAPWSRPLASWEDRLEWVSVCWAWSLSSFPRAAVDAGWQFPGWIDALPASMPQFLTELGNSYFNRHRVQLPMQNFLFLVKKCLEKGAPEFQEHPPVIFKIALLARAANGDGAAAWPLWAGIIAHQDAERALLELVETASSFSPEDQALAWWPSLLEYHIEDVWRGTQSYPPAWKCYPRKMHDDGHSELMQWVLRQLEAVPGEAVQALNEEQMKFLAINPGLVPAPLKRELLKFLHRNRAIQWRNFEVVGVLFAYGAECARDFEPLLDCQAFAQDAAKMMWTWVPEHATQLLRGVRATTHLAMKSLILFCPHSALGDAITQLQEQPDIVDTKLRREWVRFHLPNARRHAEALRKLAD